MLLKRKTKIVKIIWLVNNLRNILMPGNSQSNILIKVLDYIS